MTDDRLARLYALKTAAEALADPHSELGRRARIELVDATGLSPEGVDYALKHCLEASVTRGTLSGLVGRAKRARRAHVLLSSNVFVATFRAIALALCQSPQVDVRTSRREPVMAKLLHEGSGGAFEIVQTLTPASGEHVWAYGHDATLRELKKTLPSGVHFHGHGAGMGVAVLRESAEMRKAELAGACDALCRDVIAFDQRGCLSPRVVVVQGSRQFAEEVCDLLVEGLGRWEERVPRGGLSDEERSDIAWHEATMFFLGSCVRSGKGLIFLDPVPERIIIPPVGRLLHVTVTSDAPALLRSMNDSITTVGLFNPGPLEGLLHECLGPRRYVALGQMQTPAFDGPVDLRVGTNAVVL